MTAGHEHEFTPDAPLILMHPRDNVATALMPLEPGQQVTVALEGARYEVAVRQPIPFGHKVALTLIPAGDHVHVHNIAGTRGRGDLRKEG